MPTVPCKNAITCENGGDPAIDNFSSEAIDSVEFLAIGWVLAPPRNYPFSPAIPTPGTPVVGTSPIGPGPAATDTQGEENQRVIRNTPPRPPPYPTSPPVVYFNEAQSCAYTCPDGSLSFFTVPAGTFAGTNPVVVQRQAYAYACRQAARHHTCNPPHMSLSAPFNPRACLSNHFSGTIVVSHASPPINFEITAGALPTGVLIGQSGVFTILVTGVPQVVGAFTFTVTVTDAVGQTASQEYAINVLGITNPDLPDGTVGTAYAEAFNASGGTAPFTFQVLVGALPDGLTMDGTGVVSGTPTTSGVSDFTVGVTSADGNVCEVDCSITITSTNIWTAIVWDELNSAPNPPFFNQATGSGLGTGTSYHMTYSWTGPFNGTGAATGQLNYAGGAVMSHIHMVITATGAAAGAVTIYDHLSNPIFSTGNQVTGTFDFNFNIPGPDTYYCYVTCSSAAAGTFDIVATLS